MFDHTCDYATTSLQLLLPLSKKIFFIWSSSKKGHNAPLIANVTKINYNPMGVLGSIINII
jgi:hypothetical protein